MFFIIDLYISTETDKPSITNFQWFSQRMGDNLVEISPKDTNFVVGIYYVAVFAFRQDSEFEISVQSSRALLGYKLETSLDVESGENMKQCEYW